MHITITLGMSPQDMGYSPLKSGQIITTKKGPQKVANWKGNGTHPGDFGEI